MRGNIYKVAPSITKEEILAVCKYDDVPDYGDVMTYEEFMGCVESYGIIDYDGSGELMLFDKVVKNTSTWVNDRCVYFRDKFFVPFDVLHNIFGDDMKLIWFNK